MEAVLLAALDLLLPSHCAGCHRRAPGLCAACIGQAAAPPANAAPPGVNWWTAPFAYDGAVRIAVIRLKYHNHRTATRAFANAMAGSVRPALGMAGVDVVTWVPAVPRRRRARGFDQSRLLAREVGRQLGLPVRSLLARPDEPPQTGRSRRDRRRAPLHFVVRRPPSRRVLLVDDVATTGATLAAAARALRAAGADMVAAVTAARTAPGRHPTAPASSVTG